MFIRIRKCSWGVLFLCGIAQAQTPARTPYLRIEGGTHTAAINQISVDADNRYVVTGSHDKTVRVWDLATGGLVRTLRPPIGAGDEGAIFSAAISPDGRTIACGGTGREWDQADSIYLFDRSSGAMVRRIGGLPGGAERLAWSRDGRFLAATLSAGRGMRLYRTSDYSLAGEDTYGGSSHGVDFAPSGTAGEDIFVTSSYDGLLRLYSIGREFRLKARQPAPGGKQPFSVRFSPDGSRIAVGYLDTNRVDVLWAKDLTLAYSPDTTQSRYLLSVAWSFDGGVLYAGGRNAGKIRSWTAGGKGRHTDIGVEHNTTLGIEPLNDGRMVFCTADGSFGVIERDGRARFTHPSVIPDYRRLRDHFLVSRDGGTVQFHYRPDDDSLAVFSVADRQIHLGPAPPAAGLQAPITSAAGISLTNADNSVGAILNGRALPLDSNEESRVFAMVPLQGFLLGSNLWLNYFDPDGNRKWRTATPASVYAVNIAGNRKVAVAAFSDGTIRWYRFEDGQELMALFPHNDRKRWVLWTPSGYYDASPGGEDLIGWHINREKDAAADFYPVSRFRANYYRPEVLARIFTTYDEVQAVQLAANGQSRPRPQVAAILPPSVSVISPADGEEVSTGEVLVRYELRARSGQPVTGVRVLVDGRPIGAQRDLRIEQLTGAREVKIRIPERDTQVSIIAENQFSASEPAILHLRWRGVPKGEFVIQPKLYVLAVGVSKYRNPDFALQFPAKDARDFAAAMLLQKGQLYRDVETRLVTDDDATREGVLDGLDWIERSTTQHDVAMVLLSGHGVNDANGVYYFIPADVNPENLRRSAVPFSEIRNTVQALAGKVLFFVDTCHSGNVMGGTARGGGPDIGAVVNELASAENGAVVFAASTGRQVALENADWGNGAFTKAVIEGLRGGADVTSTGRITVNMLDLYVSERVKELTGGKQTPTTTKPATIPDFPVAIAPRKH